MLNLALSASDWRCVIFAEKTFEEFSTYVHKTAGLGRTEDKWIGLNYIIDTFNESYRPMINRSKILSRVNGHSKGFSLFFHLC